MGVESTFSYDVFYDECKEGGFWHSFIFIPRMNQLNLLNLLLEARTNLNYFHPIYYTSVNKKTKSNSEKVRLIKSWITILHYALQEQKIDADIYLGHKTDTPVYRKIKGTANKIGVKYVVLREKDCLKSMFSDMSYSKKVEATFRMGLKGGCHFLFKDLMKIGNIYVDHPEKNFNRSYDGVKILDRLRREIRDNILFEEDSRICPIDKNSYREKDLITEFMQLADISVGAIRTRALKIKEPFLRYEIAHPLSELLEKDIKNKARMNNSRFLNSFSLSEAWLKDESWQFDNLKIENQVTCQEPSLF
ncbi:MAG: hypothetical protein HXY48_00745 [Ignavibacteriaceae bacterium]|nr:hypothetical protein [Ignavibacteriaceae bacterium]